MENYSLHFLHQDWDGAGYDFGFACAFNEPHIDKDKVSELVRNVVRVSRDASLKYIHGDRTGQWQGVGGGDAIDRFLDSAWDWTSTQLLVLDVTTKHGFKGYVELNQPDHMIVGGSCDSFYTGNAGHDYALVEDLVELVQLGVAAFGEGYGWFGAGSDPIKKAIEIRDGGNPANLTLNMDVSVLTRDIFKMCKELRVLNTDNL